MKKLVTKKMIKGLINLDDERYGWYYKDIIDDINSRTPVTYFPYLDSQTGKDYNWAVSNILLMLLYIECGNYSKSARMDMASVMYKYQIATENTAEQNLRGPDVECCWGVRYDFKLTACLNMGLDHFDLTPRAKSDAP